MYAVVYAPNFAAQVAAQQRPELRKNAFALVEGEPSAEVVVAANKAARSSGVETGMTRLQAETISGVTVARRVLEDEASALTVLHTIACMFSPRIESVENPLGTYALNIRGMNGLFGDEAQLASKLRQRITEAGFLVNIAVAQNFDAAVCLARGRNGISVVPPGHESEALRDLPLHVLNPSAEQAETFHAWGIRTCGQLAALSETNLISRVSHNGAACLSSTADSGRDAGRKRASTCLLGRTAVYGP